MAHHALLQLGRLALDLVLDRRNLIVSLRVLEAAHRLLDAGSLGASGLRIGLWGQRSALAPRRDRQ